MDHLICCSFSQKGLKIIICNVFLDGVDFDRIDDRDLIGIFVKDFGSQIGSQNFFFKDRDRSVQ